MKGTKSILTSRPKASRPKARASKRAAKPWRSTLAGNVSGVRDQGSGKRQSANARSAPNPSPLNPEPSTLNPSPDRCPIGTKFEVTAWAAMIPMPGGGWLEPFQKFQGRGMVVLPDIEGASKQIGNGNGLYHPTPVRVRVVVEVIE